MKRVQFLSEDIVLEGLLSLKSNKRAAIITHPHPLFGGNMHNTVVESIHRACETAGLTTLRFNFRGAGASQGIFNDGIGEQQDLSSAVDYIVQRGMNVTWLAGYSFGSWVNALAAHKPLNIQNMLMVSPPVAFLDFSDIQNISPLRWVISGSNDDIAPPSMIKKQLSKWNSKAKFINLRGADHFYMGFFEILEKKITAILSS